MIGVVRLFSKKMKIIFLIGLVVAGAYLLSSYSRHSNQTKLNELPVEAQALKTQYNSNIVKGSLLSHSKNDSLKNESDTNSNQNKIVLDPEAINTMNAYLDSQEIDSVTKANIVLEKVLSESPEGYRVLNNHYAEVLGDNDTSLALRALLLGEQAKNEYGIVDDHSLKRWAASHVSENPEEAIALVSKLIKSSDTQEGSFQSVIWLSKELIKADAVASKPILKALKTIDRAQNTESSVMALQMIRWEIRTPTEQKTQTNAAGETQQEENLTDTGNIQGDV